MDIHLISYFIGIIIIVLSHIWLLVVPEQSSDVISAHSIINLVGASSIAYYFMNKENYIAF